MRGDTRVLLIETAERLFAERGVNAVSLREIGATAGQRNTGAVRYHFGTKEALVNAVFEHRMTPINEHRLAMLAELDATGRSHDVRGLTEAYLLPLAAMLGDPARPSWYLRFCVHASFVAGAAPNDLDAQPWTRGVAIVRDRLREILRQQGVPAELRSERWTLYSGHLTHALADRELLTEIAPDRLTTSKGRFLSHLLDTAVSLAVTPVSAPVSERPHANRRRSA
jgi:AcrR family transcriptional regulator